MTPTMTDPDTITRATIPLPQLMPLMRKAAALDWLMANAMDERWLDAPEAREHVCLVIPSRYSARADGDYLEELERAREECKNG